MLAHFAPVLFCILLWWLGTGVVLRLNHAREDRRLLYQRISFAIMAIAVGLIAWLGKTTTLTAAYASFTCAVVLWGCLENAHSSGCLLGPRIVKCPINVTLSTRFRLALNAMLYHELALAGMAIMVLLVTNHGDNKTGLYTYLVLWLMRISAELNVFFGVANLPEEWLPVRLRYLASYRVRKKMSFMFPISISVSSLVCVWIFTRMPTSAADPFAHATHLLLGCLMTLAVVEHWVMVLPLRLEALWNWAAQRQNNKIVQSN